LAVIVYKSIQGDLTPPYYGGYPGKALLLLGVGWVVITILLAVLIAIPSWDPEKLKYEHTPEEEHLLA
jgi:hypothetical protein